MAQIPIYDNRQEGVGDMEDRVVCAQVVTEVKKAVVGKDEVVVKLLLAILARGHVLLEDIPGVGKTTLALAFSRALGLTCRRARPERAPVARRRPAPLEAAPLPLGLRPPVRWRSDLTKKTKTEI